MIISTMNELPGYAIEEVFGEVFGLTVRSRNVGSQVGASLKSLVGGETPPSSDRPGPRSARTAPPSGCGRA